MVSHTPSSASGVAAAKFLDIKTRDELASILGVTFNKHLVYYLYRKPKKKLYFEFEIKKRKGGTRLISAPAAGLKIVQQRLAGILNGIYRPKRAVNGYVLGRNVITNAEPHVGARYILNVDLEDFFGSINFGRVRGMFMAKPYGLPPSIATVLAQLCCHENKLPQGAPTSPIISNMICGRLDSELVALAKKYRCRYSRYADDITISTTQRNWPSDLASIDVGASAIELATPLARTISGNGFKINASKTRLLTRGRRQRVTGLVVNKFVNLDRRYIRNVRGALHAWQTYGLADAQKFFVKEYEQKSRYPGKEQPLIVDVLYGRIQHVGFVRGWNDPVYVKLRDWFNHLSPKKIRVPSENWATALKHACWVIEDNDGTLQGTAFFLAGYGLITCSHCIGLNPYIYHPGDPSKRYRVAAKQRNHIVDLALLECLDTVPDARQLPPLAFASAVEYGDEITLVGYPDHAPGKDVTIKKGEVQGFTTKSGIRRFNISAPIVAGNSGGPVLGRSQRVIGVAVTGSDKLSTAGETDEHGVIPISALTHLTTYKS
ncbi:MAG TPA: reverse transcriptase domain-containing protein [Xanthobacteraceae bacterium]|nr:reverse transcriptase domain-containing protein [Xanthobacteraceae bacterium]